jgi:hypothetical protein
MRDFITSFSIFQINAGLSLKQKLETFYFQDKEDPGKVADLLSEDTLDSELDKRAYQYLETRYILK